MKRRLSMFLALCMMLSCITPALDANAASAALQEVQSVVEETAVDEATTDESVVEDELLEEDTSLEEEIVENEETIIPEEEVSEETDVSDEEVLEETESSEETEVTEETEELQETMTEVVDKTIPEVVEEVKEIKTYNSSVKVDDSFAGEWGTDNSDVSVTSYVYGADLLLVRKGSSGLYSTLDAQGVLLVEYDADVDLTAYADNTTVYESFDDPFVVAKVDGGTVRYVPLESTYTSSFYLENTFCKSIRYRVSGLEPGTSYSYLLVRSDFVADSGDTLVPALNTGETAVVRGFATNEAPDAQSMVKFETVNDQYSRTQAIVDYSALVGLDVARVGIKSAGGEDTYTSAYATYDTAYRTENLPGGLTGQMSYYYWQYYKDLTYPFAVGESTKEIVPFAVVRVFTENGTEEVEYVGQAVEVSRRNIDDLYIEKSDATYADQSRVEIDTLFGNVEVADDIIYKIAYRVKGTETWTEEDWNWEYVDTSMNGALEQYDIYNLASATEYEYQYKIYGWDRETLLAVLPGGTFTTEGEAVTLTKKDIPDDCLWAYLAGNAESISSEDLLYITELNIYSSHAEQYGPVKDLTGIGYLKNLQKCYLDHHALTNIEPVLECKKLKSISFYDSGLTDVIDFSGFPSLTYLNLNGNHLSNEKLADLKYPEGITLYTDNQTAPVTLEVSDTTICREDRDVDTYALKVYVNNSTSYGSYTNLLVEDVTDANNVVDIYNSTNTKCTSQRADHEDYNGKAYQLVIDVRGLSLTEGNRSFKITWKDNNDKIYTQTFNVIVDPNAVGETWSIPDEELSPELKAHILQHWDMKKCDVNKDGKLSYTEVATIKELYISYLGLTDYSFLRLMPALEKIEISSETTFTDQLLKDICSMDTVKNVKYFNIEYIDQLTDISPLGALKNLQSINLYGCGKLKGLSALKGLSLTHIGAYADNFYDEEIFDFICSKEEVTVQAGKTAKLVSDALSMSDTSKVSVEVTPTSVAAIGPNDKFTVFGFRAGEAKAVLTYGDIVREVKVIVTAADFDYDPPLGPVVPEADRMNFAGTDGIENARVSRTLVDSDDNIWNISTRKPEKILKGSEYTKYAARIIYDLRTRFGAISNSASADYSLYLDNEGTLWAYSKNYSGYEYNFENRIEVMRDVKDWQDAGYTQEAWHGSDYNDDEYLLILRNDGSLWYYGYNPYMSNLQLTRLEKIEESGTVKSIHTNSYLTNDGEFYRVRGVEWGDMNIELMTDHVVNVWDNTALTIVQNSDGNYYNEYGYLNIDGNIDEFLIGNYWNPEYIREINYGDGYYGGYEQTQYDMVPSYILMDNGKLYRSHSSDYTSKTFKLWDSGVTDIDKDYYWKGDTPYAYTKQTYEEYIGIGAGRGMYPVEESDGTMTLYVNGVPYLTKVSDWVMADQCVYAVRIDNTLWWFDEETVPRQVDFSKLSGETKNSPKDYTEIDITDLKNGTNSIQITWTALSNASSYRVYFGTSDYEEQWASEVVTGNSYTCTGLTEGNRYYFKIVGLDGTGGEIGSSHSFSTYTTRANIQIDNIEVVRGKSSSTANVTVTVGPADLAGKYQLDLRIVSEDYDSETGNAGVAHDKHYYLDCSGGGTYTISAKDLKNGAYYSANLSLCKDGDSVAYAYSNFDTQNHQYLTEAEIPDAEFRNTLKEYSEKLDLYELQKVEYISIDNPKIKDLTGLELLTNLIYIDVEGLDKEVVEKVIGKLPATVEYLCMNFCGLTSIPNVSVLPKLREFSLTGNRIPEEEFSVKNPFLKTFIENYEWTISDWLESQAQQQLGEVVVYIAPTYYKTTINTYPFMAQFAKIDGRHEYKLDIYEGGKVIYSETAEDNYGSRIIFNIMDIGVTAACEKTWKIVVTDLTENKEIYNAERKITFADSVTGSNKKQLIPASFDSFYFDDPIFLTKEQARIVEETPGWTGRLKDSKGNVYEAELSYEVDNRYPEEYEDFWNVSEECIPTMYSFWGGFPWNDEEYKLPSGTISLEILDAAGKVVISIKDLAEITKEPYITNVYTEGNCFDYQGEYLYVRISGHQMGDQVPEVVLTSRTGEIVYDEEPELLYSYDPVWRYHLTEEYRLESHLQFEVIGDYVGETSGNLWIDREEGYIYNLYKDMSNGGIIGFASSAIPDGTELIVKVETEMGIKETVDTVVKDGKFFAKLTKEECLEEMFVYTTVIGNGERYANGDWTSCYGDIRWCDDVGLGMVYTDAGWFFYNLESNKAANIVIRDAQTSKLVKEFVMPANSKFENMNLAGLQAGTLYMVSASNEYGTSVFLGMFELETKTKDLGFTLTDPSGDEIDELYENVYRLNYSAALKNKVFVLDVDTLGNADTTITAASSNTAAAAVKVSGKKVNITLKSAGVANITVTAKDSKYAETITLDIRDYTPRFELTSLAINRAVNRTAGTNVYPVYNTEIVDVAVDYDALTAKEISADYADYFETAIVEGKLEVTLADSERSTPLKSASYRLPVTMTVVEPEDFDGAERQIEAVLTVKLSDTKPKVTVKQTEKINPFYTDTRAVFTLTPNVETISDVYLVGEGEEGVYFAMTDYDFVTGEVILEPTDLEGLNALKGSAASKAYKVTLAITVGETTLNQNVTIGKAATKPSIALDVASSKIYQFDEINEDGTKETVFAGKAITFTPIDKKTKIPVENITVVMKDHYKVSKKGEITQNFSDTPEAKDLEGFLDNYSKYVLEANEDGSYTIHFVGTANASASIYVQGDNWTEPIKVVHKATVTKSKMTAKLNPAKVTLNKNYLDQKTLLVTSPLPGAEFELGDVVITPPKKVEYAENDIQIVKSEDGTGISVSVADGNTLVKGTYKAIIPVTFTFSDGTSYTPKELSLTISIIDTVITTAEVMAENSKAKVNAVKWKTSGKVDVIARETGVITLTPTVSQINAVVADVEFSEADYDLGLDQIFDMEVVDGKVVVRLQDGVSVSTKDKFKLNPMVTLMTENEELYEEVLTPTVNVQPTQSSVKMTLAPKQAVMYQYSSGTHMAEFSYTLKAAEGVTVSDVTLKDAKVGKQMLSEFFEVSYDADTELITVTLINDSIPVKTYTLNLQISFADQASNSKPLNVSTKVVIKK